MTKWLLALIAVSWLPLPCNAAAQGKFVAEEHFHDLFITAGYSTAFGAALGAAFLGLTDEPTTNLRFVAIGASLGFIGGSLLGTYIVISPTVSQGQWGETGPRRQAGGLKQQFAAVAPRGKGARLVIQPTWNLKENAVQSWQAAWTLSDF